MSKLSTPALRIATYNVHGCVGTDRRRSERRIAEVIAETRADIVGLQELDLKQRRSGGVDQTGFIAKQLGWHSCFYPAIRNGDEQYGNAVLSRYPLTLRRGAELPGGAPFFCRESRAALLVEAETELGRIQIINTHFGLGARERLRAAQLLMSQSWLGAIGADTPLILLGDLNCLPGSPPYRTFSEQHLRDVRTLVEPTTSLRTFFPTLLPMLAVDHIFVNATLRPLSVVVHRTPLARIASDHFPLVVELTRSGSPNE